MKNKFFVSRETIPLAIVCFILCVVTFFIIVAVAGFPEPTYLLVIMIILLLALPFLLLIFGLVWGCLMIEVTEEGIATVLFGKRRKFFRWEEISKAETHIDNRGAKQYVLFCRNKEKIYFSFYCLDHSRMIILKRYAPDYIIDKLNNKEN